MQTESHIHLILPLSGPIRLDPTAFPKRFLERWGFQIACGETPKLANDRLAHAFLAGDGNRNAVVTTVDQKLPAALTDLLLSPMIPLAPAEADGIRSHRAAARIDYLFGNAPPKQAVELCSQLLLSLFQFGEVQGFANLAAQSYRPRGSIPPELLSSQPLDPDVLSFLFVSTQAVTEPSSLVVHTHGMEQFALPNLEVPFPAGASIPHAHSTVLAVAADILGRGTAPSPGESFHLQDHPRVLRAVSLKEDPDHPSGLMTFA